MVSEDWCCKSSHEPPISSMRSALKRARLVPMYLVASLATGVPGPQNERFTPEIWWLEDLLAFWVKRPIFRCKLLVSGRVVLTKFWIFFHLEIVLKLENFCVRTFSHGFFEAHLWHFWHFMKMPWFAYSTFPVCRMVCMHGRVWSPSKPGGGKV